MKIQIHRKHIYLLVLVITLFSSCVDEKYTKQGSIIVNPYFSEEISFLDKTHIEVQLIDNISKQTIESKQLKQDNGSVVFENIIPGEYSISVQKQINVEDSKNLFGCNQKQLFKGYVNSIRIKSGEIIEKDIKLNGNLEGTFVIKEVFYQGTIKPENGKLYFDDFFIELYNNSNKIQYADNLIIGHSNPYMGSKSELRNDIENYTYLYNVYRFKGNGRDYPILPGESFIFAKDAINHTQVVNGKRGVNNLSVNLENADWEYHFNEENESNADNVDNPNARNVEIVFPKVITRDLAANLKNINIIIAKVDNLEKLEFIKYSGEYEMVKFPTKDIIDCFRASNRPFIKENFRYNFFPTSIDKKWLFHIPEKPFSKSARRKTYKFDGNRRILKNSNCTEEDFEIINHPTPKSFK